jgi:hypothetical protein
MNDVDLIMSSSGISGIPPKINDILGEQND